MSSPFSHFSFLTQQKPRSRHVPFPPLFSKAAKVPNPPSATIPIPIVKDIKLSMGFYDKHNNAAGKLPDYGAIFLSNSTTKRECFKKGLFGLPSSAIHFVEQIKAGMILFLFEYEKRQLHGVFKAASDGGMNIVPNAFSSLRTQFPAQVKFIPIWHCKPLSQSVFKYAIIENYFSANKFNFGLSEKQVHELLHLFSMRRLEPEIPERLSSRMKYLKSESYPMGKSGRSVDCGMHIECVKDDGQGVGASMSPVMQHKFQGDSIQYYGEAEFRFNASGSAANKQGRPGEFSVDTSSGYIGNYTASHDDFGYASHEKEHYMDMHCGPTLSSGYSRSLSDKIRVNGDGVSTTSRLSEELRQTGQRMSFSDDNPGLHHSSANSTDFYGKPELEHNSLIQNQLRPTSGTVQPIHQPFYNSRATRGGTVSKSTFLYDPDYTPRPSHLEHNSLAQNQFRPTSDKIQPVDSCATHGDVGSKRTFLYDPEYPDLNFSQSSSVRFNNGPNSILESALPSNCGMNSSSNQTRLMPTELNDMNRCHDVGYDFLNHGLYGRDRDCLPFNVARKADQIAAESVVYEGHNDIPSLNSSSSLVPPSDIGSDRVNEIFSLFQNRKSYLGDDVHPMSSRGNLDHEMTLEKNNESFIPDVPWASEGYFHVQYDDSLVNEYDTECYGDCQNRSFGYPKKKNSVFSRLTFMQDVNKIEKRNKASYEGYGMDTSVDQVMEMVHQSHHQWMLKRKATPLVKRNIAESLKDKTPFSSSRVKSDCSSKDKIPIISSRMKRDCSLKDKTQISPNIKKDCSERSTNDVSMDLTAAASGGNTNKTPVVDFKRRSKVRKFNDESEIKSSNESTNAENVVLELPKRRKLIRPNFNKNSTPDNRGIHLRMSQNVQAPFSHQSSNLNNVCQNGCDLVKMEDNLKTDAEGQKCIGSVDASTHAKGFVCGEGVRASDRTAAGSVQSECLENTQNLTASSASCKDQSCHIQKDLPTMDSIESYSEWQKYIGQPHSEDKSSHDKGLVCGEGLRARDGTAAGGDGSKCLESIKNLKASLASCKDQSCHIQKGLPTMDSIDSVFPQMESLHSISQDHHADMVILSADRRVNAEEVMSQDGSSSCTFEIKDVSDCFQKSDDKNAPHESSYDINDSLHPICQEHHVDVVVSADGTNMEKEISKDGGSSFTIEDKNRSEFIQNSDHEKSPTETSSHVIEAYEVMDSVKSVSSNGEAQDPMCLDHHVDKMKCAGRGINTDKEIPKDGDPSLIIIEAKDGSGSFLHTGNENGPIAATFHSKESLCMTESVHSVSLDAVHSTC
ncbi:uncharacterized protein LOC130976336 isoform X1 [Arachis stenosperma]|uniref:uncharacterized protein LOC130976336 isoform X1 n=1 Tax=Arachis stenosperma TaxID=217475 RepID=UPI0025AD9BC9|nr:uncharacterized protein LOC130976336 isoform X1 [Arachis stenosperma]